MATMANNYMHSYNSYMPEVKATDGTFQLQVKQHCSFSTFNSFFINKQVGEGPPPQKYSFYNRTE